MCCTHIYIPDDLSRTSSFVRPVVCDTDVRLLLEQA